MGISILTISKFLEKAASFSSNSSDFGSPGISLVKMIYLHVSTSFTEGYHVGKPDMMPFNFNGMQS
jgi:hypothetical protein